MLSLKMCSFYNVYNKTSTVAMNSSLKLPRFIDFLSGLHLQLPAYINSVSLHNLSFLQFINNALHSLILPKWALYFFIFQESDLCLNHTPLKRVIVSNHDKHLCARQMPSKSNGLYIHVSFFVAILPGGKQMRNGYFLVYGKNKEWSSTMATPTIVGPSRPSDLAGLVT